MRRKGVVVGSIASALILGALAATSVTATARPEAAIAASVASMRTAFQRGDAKAVAAFYTEDADVVGSVSLRGRAAIERHMSEIIGQGIRDVRFEGQESFPGDDYAAETGRALFFDRTGTRVAVLSYMTLWKRDGGAWRIHRDVSFPVAYDVAAIARMVAKDAGFSVKETAPFHAVVLRMSGSYKQHGDAIGKLAVWLSAAGVRPLGPPFGRYLNSPDETPEAALEWEVGFPVPEGTQAEAPFEVREIADGSVATVAIGGPHDTTPRPWAQLVDWADKQGYQITGPAMEIWQEGPKTEMRVAVRK
jgi:AraC family transcriptional regulator